MAHTHADALRWTEEGTELLLRAADGLTDADLGVPGPLPCWTRGHLLAHVAANAEALDNLVTWARTGVETPMYASPEERAAGIARGARLTAAEARAWLHRSAEALAEAMARLTPAQWAADVRTAQGRTLPATQIPWLRSREVMVHAVDLDRGIAFVDLPDDFLAALVDDIRAKRGDVPTVDGPAPEVAAWLAGRPHGLVAAPDLGPWL